MCLPEIYAKISKDKKKAKNASENACTAIKYNLRLGEGMMAVA
jgi:hypothetical protein